jgi:hypothetical protein
MLTSYATVTCPQTIMVYVNSEIFTQSVDSENDAMSANILREVFSLSVRATTTNFRRIWRRVTSANIKFVQNVFVY